MGGLETGQSERRGGKIEEAAQVVTHATGGNVPWPAHDQGNVGSRIVNPALAPRQAAAMIAGEEDDRAVGHSGVIDRFQHLAHLVVDGGNQIVVVGQIAADHGRVGIVRRHAQHAGVVAFGGR